MPLWPLERPLQPGVCGHCGAPRVFELQLMAPAIAVLLDCSGWVEPQQLPLYASGINAAANWDLVTVAVFTCSRSCWVQRADGQGPEGQGGGGEGGGEALCCLAGELAVLVLEDECHLRLQ